MASSACTLTSTMPALSPTFALYKTIQDFGHFCRIGVGESYDLDSPRSIGRNIELDTNCFTLATVTLSFDNQRVVRSLATMLTRLGPLALLPICSGASCSSSATMSSTQASFKSNDRHFKAVSDIDAVHNFNQAINVGCVIADDQNIGLTECSDLPVLRNQWS